MAVVSRRRIMSIMVWAALLVGGIFLLSKQSVVLPVMHQFLVSPAFKDMLIAVCFACIISIGAIIGIAWYIVRTLTRPKKEGDDEFIPLSLYAFNLPAEAVSFPCHNETHDVRGLYIPHPGATSTILICPGYRRTLSDVLVTCKHIWEAGHTVLAFEFYGHGLPVGAIITLGYREIDDFMGAVAYAKHRAPTTRLGAIGYSMGAATAIMACARTNDVEAVIADSSFATQWGAVEVAMRKTLHVSLPLWIIRLIYQTTDVLLWWRTGHHFRQVEPVREIRHIAPRPIMIIHGLQDTVIDPRDGQCLYDAAAEPKTLWLIPQCEHIRGYFVDSEGYTETIQLFFERYLKKRTSCDLELTQLSTIPESG